MKRRIIVAVVLASLCMTACGTHKHSFSEADCVRSAFCAECGETEGEALGHSLSVGVCRKCGEVQNEEIMAMLNDFFASIMDEGSALVECISEIGTMPEQLQYEQFLKADKCTAAMEGIYEEINTTCANYEELNTIVYQTNLLKNTCPATISGSDAVSLANQGILYQVYLQQLSSSCSYLSEELGYLAGNREQAGIITYFAEVSEMPTPDTVIYGITYYSTQNAPGNVQYLYLLGNDETEAMLNYNLFLSAIEATTELKVDISDSMAMVSENGNMLSAMMAGNDSSIGYFLTVSFRA